ncbi:MAG TPA: hypothetical protein VF788_19720 [Pseudonocardiaceae bacterium]
MPQGLLHHFEIHVGREHERRRAVAQVVQAHRRQASRSDEVKEPVADHRGVQTFPVLPGEHLP